MDEILSTFLMQFLLAEVWRFHSNFTEVCLQRANWSSIGLGNGLLPHALTWTEDDLMIDAYIGVSLHQCIKYNFMI